MHHNFTQHKINTKRPKILTYTPKILPPSFLAETTNPMLRCCAEHGVGSFLDCRFGSPVALSAFRRYGVGFRSRDC